MARVAPIQNTFTGGLLTRRLRAREDLEVYGQGMRQALNGLILPHGGFMKRSGSYFVQEIRGGAARVGDGVALIPFDVATDQQYVMEVGAGYIRFYANHGPVESSPGVPYEVTSTPWGAGIPRTLRTAQQIDVQYMVCPTVNPYKLTRNSATSFTLAQVLYVFAPMAPSNITTTTLAVDTGALTATFSAVPKPGGLLTADDVGRTIRWFDWQFQITAVTSTTTADLFLSHTGADPAAISGTATTDWALGLFSNTDGPRAVIFHDGRLIYGGTRLNPDVIICSKSDDYDNFDRGISYGLTPTIGDDDYAIVRRIQGKRLQTIQWLASSGQGLVIGTSAGEYRMFSSDTSGVLTPKSTVIRPMTYRGSAFVNPMQMDSQVVFVQQNQRQVYEIKYDVVKDNFSSRDLMLLAEDVPDSDVSGLGGFQRLAYQHTPDSVIWLTHGDGSLVSLTYEPDQKVIGVSGHRIGDADAPNIVGAGGRITFDDVCVIQNPSVTAQELWFLATLYTSGFTKQYVCYMDKQFRPALSYERSTDDEKIRALDEAFFVDIGASLDAPKLVSSFTKANPGVFTVTSHGFSNGDRVKFRVPQGPSELDRLSGIVRDATTHTFTLDHVDTGANVDTTSWATLSVVPDASVTNMNSPLVRKEVMTVTGLSHLQGLEVSILADGAIHPTKTVSGGSITLDRWASIVRVGLGYQYRGETQGFNQGARLGTGQGREKNADHLSITVHNTMGGSIGIGNGLVRQLQPINYRKPDGPMNQSPPLFTGVLEDIGVDGGSMIDLTVYFENNDPLPMTVLAIGPRMTIEEG